MCSPQLLGCTLEGKSFNIWILVFFFSSFNLPFHFLLFFTSSFCLYLFWSLCLTYSLLLSPLFVSPATSGFSAECQTKIDTLIPAVRLFIQDGTLQPGLPDGQRVNHHSPGGSSDAKRSYSSTMNGHQNGLDSPPLYPSAPILGGSGPVRAVWWLLEHHCWRSQTKCEYMLNSMPRDCVWCVATLRLGTTMG